MKTFLSIAVSLALATNALADCRCNGRGQVQQRGSIGANVQVQVVPQTVNRVEERVVEDTPAQVIPGRQVIERTITPEVIQPRAVDPCPPVQQVQPQTFYAPQQDCMSNAALFSALQGYNLGGVGGLNAGGLSLGGYGGLGGVGGLSAGRSIGGTGPVGFRVAQRRLNRQAALEAMRTGIAVRSIYLNATPPIAYSIY